MIGVTQPRRVAAVSTATRVADELDTGLGKVVGYQVGSALHQALHQALFVVYSMNQAADVKMLITAACSPALNLQCIKSVLFLISFGGRDIRYTSAMIATSRVCADHFKPERPKLTTHLECVQA